MIFVSQLISLTLKTPYKINLQLVNCNNFDQKVL